MRSVNRPSVQDDRSFIERARRAQIIECAIETIASVGFSRASLAEIGQQARISKSGVAYHFASKDELLTHVVIDVFTRAGEAIASRVAGETTAAGSLRAYLQANLGFIKAHPTHIVALLIILANLRGDDGGPRFAPQDSEPVIDHLEQILRDGQESGEFRDFAPRPMALAIRAAVDAAAGHLVADTDFDIDSYTGELVTLFGLATAREAK
ncbi:TetR/AcrR family transcriptional regulator [Nocardia sp. NPDC050799]|uniref:TetR/AcrR family transcriptional regulator n=1 Tax=Nocardia sp. NPDC050799 TaxID=3154842 RepID=UPI0033DB44B3